MSSLNIEPPIKPKFVRPELKRCKALIMDSSFNKLQNTTFMDVFFQRVFITYYFKVLFNCILPDRFKFDLTIKKSEDEDDIIIIKKGTPLHESMITRQNSEPRFGDIIDIETSDLTNEEFKRICLSSANISRNYTKVFKYFENLCKLADTVGVVLIPVSSNIKLGILTVYILLSICIPLIMLQFSCDFSKLEDKYSYLFSKFLILSKSTDDDRVEKYTQLVHNFRNSWVFSEFVKEGKVDYESQFST